MNLIFICLIIGYLLVTSVNSIPIVKDSDVDIENNKFLQRKPELDYTKYKKEDDEENLWSMKHCYHNIHLRWMSEASSSVYGSPIITDLFSDGKKEIIIPSFVHALDVFDAETGAESLGWPVFHKSNVHGSPFLYDIDRDGIMDIGIATYFGEIIFYKDTGERTYHSLYVPRLGVKRNWYTGLNDDPNDHDHLDIGSEDKSNIKNEENVDLNTITRKLQLNNNMRNLKQKIIGDRDDIANVESNDKQKLTNEASESFKVFEDAHKADFEDKIDRFGGHIHKGVYELSADDMQYYNDLLKTYDDYDLWYEDENKIEMNMRGNEGETAIIYLDSHIMSTPIVADIDGDGIDELIVSVTYMFDDDYYEMPEHKKLLPKNIDIDKYLAGGIVVFDLSTKFVKWSVQLDMTTKNINFAAFIFDSPSILDIDKDGKMEIIIGNSVGFIYILNCEGETLEGWPKQIGSIETRTLVDDLNGDGKIEIIAGDILGNVVMFDIKGNEIWERHLKSAITNAPVAGDINGDDKLEIIIGTASGNIFVLDAITGKDVAPFPFRVHGDIRSPITIADLTEGPSKQLIFSAFDGWMYIVDGETGCVDAKDIGEDSYSMILVDDLNDDDILDFIITTMNGYIYMFETSTPYHPLNIWTSEIRGTTNLVARKDWAGIFATEDSRNKRDVRGDLLRIDFVIMDDRPPLERITIKNENDQDIIQSSHGPYNVTLILKNIGAKEMNAGHSPVIGVMQIFNQPGKYSLMIPCPKSMSTSLIQLRMVDVNKIEFIDEFALSFHMHWHKFIKWLVSVPFMFMALFIIYFKHDSTARPLPP